MLSFLHLLQNIRCLPLNLLFQFITWFGQEVILFAVISWILWCHDKQFGYRIGFTYFLSGVPLQTMKIIFRIERPWILDPTLHPVSSSVRAATGYSFPSGHTQCAASVYSAIALRIRKKNVYVILGILVILVGFSRMYLGCHTPADVIASLCLTLMIALLFDILRQKVRCSAGTDAVIALICIVICISCMIYTLSVVNSGKTTLVLAMDGIKISGAAIGFFLSWFIETNYIHFTPEIGTPAQKLLRMLVGLIGLVLIMTVGKMILGTSVPGSIFRYFLVTCWIIMIYPFILKMSRKRIQR